MRFSIRAPVSRRPWRRPTRNRRDQSWSTTTATNRCAKAPWEDLPRTGSAWLAEHAVTDYSPAWHSPLGNGRFDAAVNLLGQTRWENYYLEGLAWLLKNVKIDGLYLDDLVYDHETMKRVRKMLDRTPAGLPHRPPLEQLAGHLQEVARHLLYRTHADGRQPVVRRTVRLRPRTARLLARRNLGHSLWPVWRNARRRRQPVARHDLWHGQPLRRRQSGANVEGCGTSSASSTPE